MLLAELEQSHGADQLWQDKWVAATRLLVQSSQARGTDSVIANQGRLERWSHIATDVSRGAQHGPFALPLSKDSTRYSRLLSRTASHLLAAVGVESIARGNQSASLAFLHALAALSSRSNPCGEQLVREQIDRSIWYTSLRSHILAQVSTRTERVT